MYFNLTSVGKASETLRMLVLQKKKNIYGEPLVVPTRAIHFTVAGTSMLHNSEAKAQKKSS